MFDRFFIKKLSDTDLVDKYKKTSDNSYVGELFERYTHYMFCVCLKYLRDEDKSKDAVMQIAEKLLTDLHRHEVANVKSWLHVVTKNHCLMQLRSEKGVEKKQAFTEKDISVFMESDALLHPDNGEDLEIKLELLEKAIEDLDPDQKNCINLFYIQDKSYNEIVENTGYSMNQVKSFIQNGKRNLKIFISDKLNE